MKPSRFSTLDCSGLTQRVYNAILAAIHQGRIHAGEKLVIEEIARELGVSRTPVREALGALAAEGLVELSAHKGARLKEITPDHLSDAYEIHALLEGYAAERAARNTRTVELLPRLRANVEALAQAIEHSEGTDSVEHLMVLNDEFHAIIHEASGNRVVGELVAHLTNRPRAYGRSYWDSAEAQRQSLAAHTEILAAIAAHDAKQAGEVMRRHMLRSRELVLERLRQNLTHTLHEDNEGGDSRGDGQSRADDKLVRAEAEV